jgi:3-oxoacyl-[acyl-carrier protein] reductase
LLEFNFKEQVALITGGTRGIGKSISDTLYDLGAHVIITGTNGSEIDRLNEDGKKNNLTRKTYLEVNFLNPISVNNFLISLNDLGKIDICINNAGINIIKPFLDSTLADFDRVNDVNLIAPYKILQFVGKKMTEQKYGRIVNIASIWGVVTRPGRSMYTTSKHALVGLTKTLAVEWASYNVLVNAVSPGFTMTELTKSTNTKEEIEVIAKQIPLKRFAETFEIADTVIYLASNLNTYITGQNIVVDGGYTIV